MAYNLTAYNFFCFFVKYEFDSPGFHARNHTMFAPGVYCCTDSFDVFFFRCLLCKTCCRYRKIKHLTAPGIQHSGKFNIISGKPFSSETSLYNSGPS